MHNACGKKSYRKFDNKILACLDCTQFIFCSIKHFRPILASCILIFTLSANAQLETAHCVHSSGIRYLLDAYLASIGACNCPRTGVYLFDFPGCNDDPYVLEFEDNFSEKTLDTGKWQNIPWGQGALKNSQRKDVSTLNNVSISDGICQIIAKKEKIQTRAVNWKPDTAILEDGQPNLREYDYTAAILFSKRKFYFGKYEIRCRMPAGNGFWPAFWLFGGERYNEIDVFDNYRGSTEIVTSIGHDYEKGSVSGCSDSRGGYDLTEWHTFSFEWQFDKMLFSIDDAPIRTISRVVTPAGNPVRCNDDVGSGSYFQLKAWPVEPMNLIFNMVIISDDGPGGSVPVDDHTPFPSAFDVDFIRYWKREPGKVQVFPNPAEGMLSISSTTTIKSLVLSDLLGKLLFRENLEGENAVLDLTPFSDGVYILTVDLDGTTKSFNIIKSAP